MMPSVISSTSIQDAKAVLRREAAPRRDALPADSRQAAVAPIAAQKFPFQIAPGTIASGFMPMKTEINALPLMRKLAEAGAQAALPVVEGRGKPLTMRAGRWEGELGSA